MVLLGNLGHLPCLLAVGSLIVAVAFQITASVKAKDEGTASPNVVTYHQWAVFLMLAAIAIPVSLGAGKYLGLG